MKDKQPDYKKSQNDPYDLNSSKTPRRFVTQTSSPNPYDLDQGYSQSQHNININIRKKRK